MTQILVSEDYKIFKRIKGNRKTSEAQIDRLRDSIHKHPELAKFDPIIINEKFEVIDGQHRLEAYEDLKLPVYYVKADGLRLEDVQVLNSATKTWTPIDYAQSYNELGNKNYQIYLDFKKQYHLNHDTLMAYLMDGILSGGNAAEKFRNGKFKVGDIDKAHKLCKRLNDIRSYYKRSSTRAFTYAFQQIASHPKYDHKRMLAKVKQYNHFFNDNAMTEDYLRDFEKIYNHHVTKTDRVRFF